MNWIEDLHADPEYRRYRLLAELQKIDEAIQRKEVYPWLNHIQLQLSELEALDAEVKQIELYNTHDVPEFLQDQLNVFSFAKQRLIERRQTLISMVDQIKDSIYLESFVLEPGVRDSGYVLIHTPQNSMVEIFAYWKRYIVETGSLVKTFYFERVLKIKTNLRVTIDRLGWYLIRTNGHVFIPNIQYLFLTEDLPTEQTVLPIVDIILNKQSNS